MDNLRVIKTWRGKQGIKGALEGEQAGIKESLGWNELEKVERSDNMQREIVRI